MYAQCVFEEGKIENAQNSLSVVINMSVSNRTICKATPLEIVIPVEGITALIERERARERGKESDILPSAGNKMSVNVNI